MHLAWYMCVSFEDAMPRGEANAESVRDLLEGKGNFIKIGATVGAVLKVKRYISDTKDRKTAHHI